MYDHGFKEMTPKSRSPYQLFAMEYAKKIYDYIIDRYRLHTADEKKPNNYVKLVSIVWNEAVLKPVFQQSIVQTQILMPCWVIKRLYPNRRQGKSSRN